MTDKMRAIDIKDGKGPVSNLFVNSGIPKPVPSPGEALVKIKAFGINRMDLMQREGMYPVPAGASKILGVEFSGVIEAFGGDGDVEDFKVGDEVFGLAYGGAYADYITVSTQMLLHKPANLSWVEAAGIPEVWFTALQAMYLIGDFKPGKSILWHAGASSVSIAGIQLSRAADASKILVTAGSDEKIDFCVNTLGASGGFNYRTTAPSQTWADGVQTATGGRGVDIIVDYIGAPYFQGNLGSAALDGRIVTLAFLGGTQLPAGVNIAPLLFKRLRYEGSTLRSRDLGYQRALRDLFLEHAMEGFKNGRFRVAVERVLRFEEIVEAHQLMESNQTKGKIICTVG